MIPANGTPLSRAKLQQNLDCQVWHAIWHPIPVAMMKLSNTIAPRLTAQSLMKELQDGDQGGVVEEGIQVIHAEEHGYGVEPGGPKADDHGLHDGDRDHLLLSVDLFGHMCCAIQTGESPFGVDVTDNEGDAIRAPSGI